MRDNEHQDKLAAADILIGHSNLNHEPEKQFNAWVWSRIRFHFVLSLNLEPNNYSLSIKQSEKHFQLALF